VHVQTGERGLLVICDDTVGGAVREAVAPVDGEPADALVAVLLALAQLSEDAVLALTEQSLAYDENTTGLTSGAERREISRVRGRLFSFQQLWLAHSQLLAPDDVLVEALTPAARRRARRVRVIFEASGTAASQLYALLGDTLTRHSTAISERLTLATVIFLPLTVSTGFFGMNFGWLTDHIGSVAAFVLLGIVLPCVLVGVSLAGARLLARD
jgi:magnesium transporter